MAIISLNELKVGLHPGKRLLGLDVGQKTIGLGISDPGFMIATPFTTLKRTKFKEDVEKLKQIVKEYLIVGMVIGLPINMNGSEGPRCQSIRQFAQNVLQSLDIPIVFWDERLSTQAVTRTLLEADLSRAKRSEIVDKMAASYILQGVLDYLKRL